MIKEIMIYPTDGIFESIQMYSTIFKVKEGIHNKKSARKEEFKT